MRIILGQGIGGTVLAWRLLQQGIPFKIIDNGHKNSSSMVAAGLWNPIVFRKINKSWMADQFIVELETFYPAIEEKLGAKFYHSIPIRRIHSSKNELDLWYEKKSLEGFTNYLENPQLKPIHSRVRQPQFGEGIVRHGGYLDLPKFLQLSRVFFQNQGLLDEEQLTDQSIEELASIEENLEDANMVIDCRGFKAAFSRFWTYLPFGLTKGEVLTIRAKSINLKEVYNAGFFLIPLGNDVYRLGATFNWESKDETPTKEARNELCSKYEAWFGKDFELLEHKASVRPTVQDRKPLFGRHPEFSGLFIFNGLGTKGVMLAPYLSKVFLDFTKGDELPVDINVDRFKNFYGTTNPQVNYPTP